MHSKFSLSRCLTLGSCSFGLFALLAVAQAEDWTRFRGSNGDGISPDSAPTQWSPTENMKWKTKLPGAGVSCPIVLGGKIFLTCYSGYGIDARDPGDQADLKRHVVCVNRTNGEIIWDQAIDSTAAEDAYSGMGVPEHGYASHTPVTDGEAVYAFLGKSGVYAFDLDGKQLWHTEVGTGSDRRHWGSASSPILAGDILVVPAIAESSSLIGLDKKTGKQIWKEETDALGNSWSTPLLVKVDDSRSDLVMPVGGEVWGLNPANGKLRWFCGDIPGDSFYTSLSSRDGIVYGSVGGRNGGGSFAIKVGGKDDVTKTNMVWQGSDQSSYATPVLHNNRMFIASRGVATAIDTQTGKQLEKVRLESSADNAPASPPGGNSRGGGRGGFGGDYSSPVVANGKLYYVKRNGEMFVFDAGTELKQLAVNRVTSDSEEFSATPAICDGQIFVRSNKNLYCIEAAK